MAHPRKDAIINSGKFLVLSDLSDPASIREYALTGHDEDAVRSGKENYFYWGQAWPLSARDKLVAIATNAQVLKKAHDDSIRAYYELSNALARGEV